MAITIYYRLLLLERINLVCLCIRKKNPKIQICLKMIYVYLDISVTDKLTATLYMSVRVEPKK